MKVVTGRHIRFVRRPWKGSSSPHQTAGALFCRKPEAEEGKNAEELHPDANGVFWSLLKFRKHTVQKKPFLSLRYHIFISEEVRRIKVFIQCSKPNHSRAPVVLHLINFIWTFQTPYATVLFPD